MADLLEALVRANLAASVAILLVLILRLPARRLFGAEAAYGLWSAVLVAGAASFLPARRLAHPSTWTADPAATLARGIAHPTAVVILWLAGVAVAVAAVALGQLEFRRRERRGQAGPAIVGVVSPRLVTPADYLSRFAPEERRIIRAHERAHIERGDAQMNAAAAALQALCWFNPLVHLAARLARQDQELACDAHVLRRLGVGRRRYAETLLKAQVPPVAPALGCSWTPPGRHPLEVRVAALASRAPALPRQLAGQAAILSLAMATAGGAWIAKPPLPLAAPLAAPAAPVSPVMTFFLYR